MATDLPSASGPVIHILAVVFGLLCYVLTTRMKRERRPPTAAVAWVLGIIAIPYLALPAYLAFGSRKVARSPRAARYCPPRGQHWAERVLASFGLPAAAAANIRMHGDGQEALQGLLATIERATRTLDVATFILGDDPLGQDVMKRLAEKARSGIRVRLLLDGFGALRLPPRYARELRFAGVQVMIFHPPFKWGAGIRNLRNHRKATIADGAVLWSGGRNLASEYFLGDDTKPSWKDLSFELDGQVAADAHAQFEADWTASGVATSLPGPSLLSPVHTDGALCQYVPSGPDQVEDTVHALLIDAAYRAERRFMVVTPYFVPDEPLETALRLAARRGVEVRIFLPLTSNHRLADFARSRSLRALAEAGVQVHLVKGMVHAKAVVVDDTLALCGSVNLDLRSLLLNHEAMFAFYDRTQICWLADWMQALAVDAQSFDASPPGLLRDVAEGLLLTLAFQL